MEERRVGNRDSQEAIIRIDERVDIMFKRLFGSEDNNGGVIGSHAKRITFLEKVVWTGMGALLLLRLLDFPAAVKAMLTK